MKRYVISPIIGSGTTGDPFRAAASPVFPILDRNVSASIPTGQDGRPLYRFCFAIVATNNLTTVLAISNLFALPEYSLDAQMGGMHADARTGMNQSVAAYDLDGNGKHIDMTFYSDADSYRSVLQSIGAQLDSGFVLNQMDASEPAA